MNLTQIAEYKYEFSVEKLFQPHFSTGASIRNIQKFSENVKFGYDWHLSYQNITMD